MPIGSELAIGEEEDLVDGRSISQLIDEHTRHGSRTWLGDKKRRRIGVRTLEFEADPGKRTMLRRQRTRHKRCVLATEY